MGQVNNNGQSGLGWFVNKMGSEWGKAWDTCPLNPQGHEPKRSKEDTGVSQSVKARVRNDVDQMQPAYPSNSSSKPKKQASLDNIQDSFAFSPEALALMGC